MVSHRRNWNSDFENYAQDLINGKEDLFNDEALYLYHELMIHANDEIEMLNKRILELEEDNDSLRCERDELQTYCEVLEENLEKIEEERAGGMCIE